MKTKKNLELYIHIPFCVRKCAYCDFLSFPAGSEEHLQYLAKLKQEIYYYGKQMDDYEVSTIFFGGGTPTVLSGTQIADLMHTIHNYFHVSEEAEITVECNPGTITKDKMRRIAEAGVNRISLGLQSSNNLDLAMLGRIHTFEDFLVSMDLVRKAGIRNINIDMMCSLPGQTPDSWRNNLKKVVSMHPEHISIYSLMVEEGTPFYQLYHKDDELKRNGLIPRLLPSEEADLEIQSITEEMLAAKGFEQYEFSNFSKPGYECLHNLGYWNRENYLGLGLGASSLVENFRFHNTRDFEAYLSGSFEPQELKELSRNEQMEEYMFLGLRKIRGVSLEEFSKIFHVSYDSIYGPVTNELLLAGMLQMEEGNLFLTRQGINVSNVILSNFLLES